MRWQTMRMPLIMLSTIMLIALMQVVPAHGSTPNTTPLAPSPRPALHPTSKPEHNHDHTSGLDSDIGRITGTIIERETGAPAAGIKVNVGGTIVVSDANGNYECYVPAGVYPVTLVLTEKQGRPEQLTQAVQVIAGQTTIQHLYYTRARVAPTVLEPMPFIALTPEPTAASVSP